MNTSVEGRPVNIDPAGKIQWRAHNAAIGLRRGTLFVNPEMDKRIDPLAIFRSLTRQAMESPNIGAGRYGTVHAVGEDLALKRFVEWRKVSGRLSDLRANVALTEGLKQLDSSTIGNFAIRGLQIWAAYTPKSSRKSSMWLMERIKPEGDASEYMYQVDKRRRLPLRDERIELYKRAYAEFSISPDTVIMDDKTTDNLLVERKPLSSEQNPQGSLVKIDVMAQPQAFQY